MYKIYKNQLDTPWGIMQMKAFLGRQLDTTKLSRGLPPGTMFYHKTGWWSFFTNDVGIVDDGKTKYIISLLTPVTEDEVKPRFKALSERIYWLIKRLHH
jgi:beta-lactamase class A